jgi:hypothetical protein
VGRIATADADTPFAERLGRSFLYPLRGPSLATCVALAVSVDHPLHSELEALAAQLRQPAGTA